MKTAIIYYTVHHGNTEKIAKVMSNSINAKLLEISEVEVDTLAKYDLIGFGSGIFFGKHHRRIIELIDKLPRVKKQAFIFSTRGGTPTWLNHHKLRKKLLEKGFNIIGEFSCKGHDTVGPLKYFGGINKSRPNEYDLRKAKKFAEKIKQNKE